MCCVLLWIVLSVSRERMLASALCMARITSSRSKRTSTVFINKFVYGSENIKSMIFLSYNLK